MKNIKLIFNIILIVLIISVSIPITSYGAVFEFDNGTYEIGTDYSDKQFGQINVSGNVFDFDNSKFDRAILNSEYRVAIALMRAGSAPYYYYYVMIYTNYDCTPRGLVYYDQGGVKLYRQQLLATQGNTYPESTSPFFTDLNYPLFIGSSINDTTAITNYLLTGDLSGAIQNIGSAQADLGYIKPYYYCDGQSLNSNGGKNFIENIRWDKLSTTGFDVTQSGVVIDFAIRDKSYYQLTYDSTNITSWIYNRVEFLSSYIYPVGSEQRAYMQGKITKSANNGNMILLGSPDGSQQTYNVNAWGAYSKNSNSDPVTRGFAQNLTNDTSDRNFINALYDYVTEHGVMLSWDIYARIRQGNNKGNWLKINKHSVPLDQQIDNLNGMVTSDNVILDTDPGNDWGGSNETDDPDEKDDVLPVGYVDPNDGSPTTIYNNYTYNYDNRSWIENHYDNNTIEDVNQGFDILKNFGMFGNWFEILFGALLPDWCLAVVTIISPIFVALIIFRVVKGVIPFV